jgi:putative transposase
MVAYRRNRIGGGTYFFTAVLEDRRSTVLVDHIDVLRSAFRVTRQERPFTVEAIVILPDHLHVVLALPQGDSDFSGRLRRIKGYFSSHLIAAGRDIDVTPTANLHFGKDAIGNTPSVTRVISNSMSTTFITIL